MLLWDSLVDVMRMLIFAYTQVCGGNTGSGILLASLTFRAILLPLSLKFARASKRHQMALQKLKPELDRIRERFRNQPEKLGQKTRQLFDKHEVPMMQKGLVGNLAQIPLFIAFYSAVQRVADVGGRFLWIGNLAKPDLALSVLVTAITCGTVFLSRPDQPASQPGMVLLLIIPVAFTAAFLLKASAGVAIYFGVSSAMSLLQGQLVKRSPA